MIEPDAGRLPALVPILEFVAAERGLHMPEAVLRLARHLPAVPAAGLEIRLADPTVVDLQQRVRPGPELGRLCSWMAERTASGPGFAALARFCDGPGLDRIEEIWLELDDGADPPSLSVFVRLAGAAGGSAAMETVQSVIAGFGLPLPVRRQAALRRCLAAGRGTGRLAFLGLMLDRPGAPFRLIFDDLDPEDIGGQAGRAGWIGDAKALQDRVDALFVYVDRIRLAMTIGDGGAEPELGLECFLGPPEVFDRRWRRMLDHLVQAGRCTPAARASVLEWPGAVIPTTATRPWPASLILDDIVHGRTAWLDCRFSHLKVSHGGGADGAVKAYMGVLEATAPDAVRAAPPAVPGTPRPLDEAIDAAIRFLLDARVQAGWWLDYRGFGEGVAEEWVTARVGHALVETGDPAALAAAARAWRLLAARTAGRPGWGWNGVEPADADSTAWGLRLGEALGRQSEPGFTAGLAFLRRHVGADGGVATYLAEDHARASEGRVINAGWTAAHGCVTAATACLSTIGDTPAEWLRRHQRPDGVFPGYWWLEEGYATDQAVEALVLAGRRGRAASGDDRRIAAAAARAALHPGKTSFGHALALRIRVLARDRGAGAEVLLAGQQVDGGWPSSAVLDIPNAAGNLVRASDHGRSFTTATALSALVALRGLQKGAGS